MKGFALVLALLVASGCLGSRGTVETAEVGSLALLVLDREQNPLPGVSVRVDDAPPATTDANGEAYFDALLPGAHVVNASAPGYTGIERRFSVGAGETVLLQIRLYDLLEPDEVQYLFGEIPCGQATEPDCDAATVALGRGSGATPALPGITNGTLRLEWNNTERYGFRLEARRNGSLVPFADRSFNQSVAGTSPLVKDIAPELVSDPLRLGGVSFRVTVDDLPVEPRPTMILATLTLHARRNANATFPPLSETDRGRLGFDGSPDRSWSFDPAGGFSLLLLNATLVRECPVGSQASPMIRFVDQDGVEVERRATTGSGTTYQCSAQLGVPPTFPTMWIGVQFLWPDTRWSIELVGDCTCEVEVQVLQGNLAR